MKNLILSIIGISVIAFSISSCKSKSNPKDVATNFLNALVKLDYEGAKQYGTPETGKMMDMLSSFSGLMPDSIKSKAKETKVEIKGFKEDGDHCEVTYTNSDKPNQVQTLDLIKVDGKWLVNASKDDNSYEPQNPEPDTSAYAEPPIEETVPTDSLKVETKK
ncbi:MAG: DUF4878 domain-containing protein [Bacteroidetes bacterium]|nr:DUF4878 domain-containing protein [Bacteroidota bacterium]